MSPTISPPVRELSSVADTVKKATACLSLTAISLTLFTGCGPQAPVSLDQARRDIEPDLSLRPLLNQAQAAPVTLTNEVQRSTYEHCQQLRLTTLAYAKILNEVGYWGQAHIQQARRQFEDTLNDSYQALLKVETTPEISAEVRQALADTRRDMLMIVRTSESGRLSARTGNTSGNNAVDGNAEMLYGLVANLDTVMARFSIPAK